MRRCLALLVALVAACAGKDALSAGGPAVVRDSAGVRIVENTHPSLEHEAWRLSARPTLTIGTVESDADYQLFFVSDAIRLDNGTIVIANTGSSHLKYFDAAGRFIVNAGGRGGGPGEFSGVRAPVYIWPSGGEAVAAWDYSRPARVSVFDAFGQFLESHSLTREPGLLPRPVDALGDGRLVAYYEKYLIDNGSEAPVGTVSRDSLRFFWYSPNGSDWGEIARLPGFERQSAESMGGRSWRTFAFSKRAVFAVGQRSMYYGSADRYEIASYSPDGTLRQLVRRTTNDLVLSSAIIDGYVDERRKMVPDGPATRREMQRVFDETPWPDSIPAYRRLLVDRAENLWVQEYTLPSDTERNWSIFSLDGVWLTNVPTPVDFRVYEIGDDYVIGLWRDADDVDHVQMYELLKSVR